MNDKTDGNWGSQRAGVLALLAAVAVLATACGSSTPSPGSSASGESANLRQELAYSQCMRTHGVPDFPDPNASGAIRVRTAPNGAGGAVNTSQERTANDACQHLLPSGGVTSPGQVQQEQSAALKFAQCMRTHGLPDFPDPTVTSQATTWNLRRAGISVQSPQFLAGAHTCQHLLPAGVSVP
jgi:hypothetical protein